MFKVKVTWPRYIAAFLCAILMLSLVPCGVIASENEISIPLTIKENNGIYVADNLYRRGFALPEGAVSDLSDFGLYDKNGQHVPAVFEVTERYKDKSIKWALCSFVTELREHEVKEFTIQNKGAGKIENPVKLEQTPNGMKLSNENLSATVNLTGIAAFGSQENMIQNVNMYLQEEGGLRQKLDISDISVIKENDLYVKVQASGVFGRNHTGVLVVTLWSGAEKLDVDFRFTIKKDAYIDDLGLSIFSKKGTEITYPACEYGEEQVVGSDYITAKLGKQTMYLISRDTEKFRGATTGENSTGFVKKYDSVDFAPLVHGKSFFFFDGVSRTHKIILSLEENGAQQIETLRTPPSVVISPESYAEAGVIAMSGQSAPLEVFMKMVYNGHDKRDGTLWAGTIKSFSDPSTGEVSTSGEEPGEVVHNFGLAYMATGDNIVYNMLFESAYAWADTFIYHGSIDAVRGANRYGTHSGYMSNSRSSHPYYGTSEGLYMAHVLSGDEYLKEIFKEVCEHIYRNTYSDKNCGEYMPTRWEWNQTSAWRYGFVESRYMIQARPLYYAYRLFEDEKFRKASLQIARWAEASQSDAGWWYQAYWNDGRGYVQPGEPTAAVKDYIFLYGLRGISHVSRFERTPQIDRVLTKAADYLASSYEKYGPSWMPTWDPELHNVQEDGSRARSRMSDIMSIEILYSAYRITGKTEHLEALLRCIKLWLCSQNADGTTLWSSGWITFDTYNAGGPQLYTLLMIDPEIRQLIQNEADKVIELGYDYLLPVFAEGTKAYDKPVLHSEMANMEITQCIYVTENDKILFGSKQMEMTPEERTKDYYTTIPEGGLWQGVENQITNPAEVVLHHRQTLHDELVARWRPIYVTGLTDKICAFIDAYDKNQATIRLYGDGQVELLITDGTFSIVPGRKYSAKLTRADEKGIALTVTQDNSGSLIATEEGLKLIAKLGELPSVNDASDPAMLFAVKNNYMTLQDGQFHPDEAADLKEFSQTIKTLTQSDEDFDGQTYSEAAEYVLKQMMKQNRKFFETKGFASLDATVLGEVSDEEAVTLGAELLEIPQVDVLKGDIELPYASVCDTQVTWKSSDESILTNAGKFKASGLPKESVTLTATITKGDANSIREFTFALPDLEDVTWRPQSTSLLENDYLLEKQSGEVELTFDLVIKKLNSDSLMGIGDSLKDASGYNSMPLTIRWGLSGEFDAINDDWYYTVDKLSVQENLTYHVRVPINTNAKRYSIYIKPEGSSKEYCIGKNYLYRNSAPEPENIDIVYVVSNEPDSYEITNVNCAKFMQAEPLTKETYDRNGLLYGKYAYEKVYLPLSEGRDVLSWMSLNPNVVDETGEILIKGGMENVSLLGKNNGEKGKLSALQVLKEFGMIPSTENGDRCLTRQNAAYLIRALTYIK